MKCLLDNDFDEEQDNSLSDDDDNDIQSLSSVSVYKTQAPSQRCDSCDFSIRVPYIANCSRWKSFADGQGTSNSLENFHGSFTPVKRCAHVHTRFH